LEGGPPIFRQDYTCPALLEDPNHPLPLRSFHPLWLTFPDHSGFGDSGHWPGPLSLATTYGVSVDVLSSGYLDVSVRRVRLASLCIQDTIPYTRWVSPFRNPRIKGCLLLPAAYRSMPRLSSPLSAKASTKCSCALD
jgi:hypothetical protein